MFNLPSMPWPTRGLAFSLPAIAAMMSLSARRPRVVPSAVRARHVALLTPDETRSCVIERHDSVDGLWQHLGVAAGAADRVEGFLDWLHALPDAAWRTVEAAEVPRRIERELDALVRSQHLTLARWIISDEVKSARLQVRWRDVRAVHASQWHAFWMAADHAAAALLVAEALSSDAFVRLTRAFREAIPAAANLAR